MNRKRNVAILVFDGAEVLDFAGPFEVFAVASELHDHRLFDVRIVAADERPVTAVNGMQLSPNSTYATQPAPDVLVIAGGAGTRQAMHDPNLREWVNRSVQGAEVVLSICSAARILAALGLLDGREATTHHEVLSHLAEIAPTAILKPEQRFVDTGKITTTGGITAGIDGSFHIVARLLGRQVAERTARYMEYAWQPDPLYVSRYAA